MLEGYIPFVATFRQMRNVVQKFLGEGREDITLGFVIAPVEADPLFFEIKALHHRVKFGHDE